MGKAVYGFVDSDKIPPVRNADNSAVADASRKHLERSALTRSQPGEGRQQDILTAEEAAALLRFNPVTIRQKARLGEIPGCKIGKEWRFSRRVLLEWLEEGSRPKILEEFNEAYGGGMEQEDREFLDHAKDYRRRRFSPPAK